MSRMPRRAAAALVAAVAVAALSGCQSGTPADASSSPTTSPSATPSATPEPSPSPTPDPTASTGPTAGPTAGSNRILSPQDGAAVPGPVVTVSGEGTAFEGTLLWRALPAGSTEPAAEGFTQGGANGEVGPFTFDVELAPGTWTIQVWEPGMGEGDTGGDPVGLVEVTVEVG